MSVCVVCLQARFAMKDYDGAERDYAKAISFDPENKVVKKQLMITRQKLKDFKENEKKKYFGMFSKFAEMDSKEKGKNMPYHVKVSSGYSEISNAKLNRFFPQPCSISS